MGQNFAFSSAENRMAPLMIVLMSAAASLRTWAMAWSSADASPAAGAWPCAMAVEQAPRMVDDQRGGQDGTSNHVRKLLRLKSPGLCAHAGSLGGRPGTWTPLPPCGF